MDINTCTDAWNPQNKLGEQKWGDWDTNTLPYRGICVSIKLCIRGGADIGNQVDIHSGTDACTHSSQGVWPEAGWLAAHTHTLPCRGIHVSIKLCIRGGVDMGSQVDINSCTDACIHSNHGVGPEAGWLGHTHTHTHSHKGAPRFPYNYP